MSVCIVVVGRSKIKVEIIQLEKTTKREAAIQHENTHFSVGKSSIAVNINRT